MKKAELELRADSSFAGIFPKASLEGARSVMFWAALSDWRMLGGTRLLREDSSEVELRAAARLGVF